VNNVVKCRRISLKISLTGKTYSSVLNEKGNYVKCEEGDYGCKFDTENLKNIESSAFL
jgi:hypothetical protein